MTTPIGTLVKPLRPFCPLGKEPIKFPQFGIVVDHVAVLNSIYNTVYLQEDMFCMNLQDYELERIDEE